VAKAYNACVGGEKEGDGEIISAVFLFIPEVAAGFTSHFDQIVCICRSGGGCIVIAWWSCVYHSDRVQQEGILNTVWKL
jgi:hypothetical protein